MPYVRAFMLDGQPLLTFERVRPWRNNLRGCVADCVGKALILPEDMKSWEEWANVDLLLNSWQPCLSILYFVWP